MESSVNIVVTWKKRKVQKYKKWKNVYVCVYMWVYMYIYIKWQNIGVCEHLWVSIHGMKVYIHICIWMCIYINTYSISCVYMSIYVSISLSESNIYRILNNY